MSHPDPDNATDTTTVKVTVDMPAYLVAMLRTRAQDEDRSFAAEMRQAVKRHLASSEPIKLAAAA